MSVGPQGRGDLALEVMYSMFTHVSAVLVDNQMALPVAFTVQSLLDTLTDRDIFEADGVHEVDHLLLSVGRRFC